MYKIINLIEFVMMSRFFYYIERVNMLFKNKFFYSITIALVLSFSILSVGPAYADGDAPAVPTQTEQPTEETDNPVVEEEVPLPEGTEEVYVEDAVLLDTEEPSPTEEETTEEPLLADLPEGTEIVVLNEDGEVVSLASQEAADAIIVGDPVWCPSNVANPTPGLNGCSGSYATFAALITDPTFLAGGKDGVIWIASNYNGADNSTINLNGSILTNLANFKLTLQGGWCDGTDVTCVGLIDLTKPSTFDVMINITNLE